MNTIQNVDLTPQKFLRTLSIIHLALITGQILFALVTIFLNSDKDIVIRYTNDVFVNVLPILTIAGILTGKILFKKQLIALQSKESLKEKLTGYQSAFIVRLALLEGPCLFGIVCYLLTGNLFHIIIAGLIILYFISLRPGKEKVETDLALPYEQKVQFDKSEEIV